MTKAISTLTLQKYKRDGRKIVCLTAYDYSMAKILDRAGVDLILVGDSLAMVALGHRTTHAVTMEEMLHHTRAVTRGVSTAMVVADLPFMSYQVDVTQAITNAGRFVKEAQAHAVKLEGATRLNLEIIERLTGMGIPVMGHLGYTPQAIHGLGGARVQGRSADEAVKLIDDARALEMAGCFSVVLEMVPTAVAKLVTEKLTIPSIGIGAGNVCDGQILVTDDMLGKFTDFVPRFVRRYADLSQVCEEAIAGYARDVKSGNFPNASESFLLPKDEEQSLSKQVGQEKSQAGEVC
ncbi:MAG: 3-methyl-2-oxobutanoate hydroxymethyltransferase [Candidatus Obscuribacter sp.]|jgi:3-methyl-2-oxobutanoate hydroxymethyltransferase|nr:3-methyl-2-oxobutanoate hydroxymethyltransferase [Candidatus Obscuribacter sp.]MDQ5968229.1 3-methyl-2-oxobutanoate hydroxymethyltransferase [Cyanobacteriota bacterium erpe_2018_sw_39hr_WHONDRS-SW48-000098_B_bin.30]MBL0187186.1 3-methyl-2-oxobutanoate hydroxymethyltransferase [Candidatus Obscuribacter sp.]MBP6350683.1 3-methyl-2-oxobutanoate hydroxymethyltransferase [Candidatus Obscuribacter sp.]MBP6593822.1 3-methyl-2-oxobutanoate hydroxymethyltransferase [Candidatus Obscuribacter sp.]